MRTIASAALANVFTLLSSITAFATTTFADPFRYRDLSAGDTVAFAGFDTGGPVIGPATLDIRYRFWNGASAEKELALPLNGTEMGPALISRDAYDTFPTSIAYDVLSLLVSGVNTLSVIGTYASGGPTTYAVGEIALTIEATPSVPLTTGLRLMLGALGLLGFGLRKRER